ncbi:hypothetical protein Tco_0710921 [Tanacetum coccineum]
MAQKIIPAAQLVSKFQGIEQCNNYAVFQSIPCSPECKIVGQILLNHPLMETLENPFVTPVNIEIIESFMNGVGYQGVVDKLFHVVVNRTNVDYAALLWWDFMNCVSQKKDVIQYPRFTKLIIADLMKKFPSIPLRLEEDYHSIKDDILLVSVYTTGNVTVRGMLILDAFLTKGTHRSTPRAHNTPTLTTASPQGKKRNQSVGESSSPQKSLELGSHKENPEHDDEDDDKEEEKVDEKEGNKMGSLEIRTEKMQTPIPTTPKSPRIN